MNKYNTAGIFLTLWAAMASAQEPVQEAWNAHVQATYIWQEKPAFSAAYSGVNSLRAAAEKSYSFSATAALGWRPWGGGELYFDPEVVQGVPLSGLTGLGGMSNGEQQKTGGANPTFYRARLFLRQSWGLGGAKESVNSDANQLAGTVDKRRLVVTAGNLALTDIFDGNAFAHDARSQFMNWALLAHGAYDFAADARGYTVGAAIEYYDNDWVLRAGRFMQPATSNGLLLDANILRHYGDQVELEHAHSIGEQPGKVRLLAFHNRANMGSFRAALADAPNHAGIPDVTQVRSERAKTGFGLNAEQNLTADVGVFARASWNDGKSETYAFSEIDRSLSFGAVAQGGAWNRAADTLGVALVRNGLSGAHRDYLGAGGHGAFVGDGQLDYRPEAIVEAYYSLNLRNGVGNGAANGAASSAWVTLDYQHIANPAYNRDRGPVGVASIRLHAQY